MLRTYGALVFERAFRIYRRSRQLLQGRAVVAGVQRGLNRSRARRARLHVLRCSAMRPTRWMRAYLVAAGIFAVLAGTLLAFGAGHTDTRFAWTISSELTTAFLNGMYWAAAVLLLVSARERRWASARFGAYAALLFMTLLLVVMLVHFDLLHTDDHRFLVSWGAWGFLTSYAVLPSLGVAAIATQLRGSDAPSPVSAPIPTAVRALLGFQAAAAVASGAALLLFATRADALWPWALTPIGARAIGSWVLALGVVSALAARDADWGRVRSVAASYAALALLQTSALARFGDEVGWSRPAAWVYVAVLASLAGVALAGAAHWGGRRQRAAGRSAAQSV